MLIRATRPLRHRPIGRVPLLCGLVLADLVLASLLYKHGFAFTCRDSAPAALCEGLSRIVPRASGMALVIGLLALALRLPARSGQGWRRPLALHAAGVLVALLPWGFLSEGAGPVTFGAALLSWVGGAGLAATGLLGLIAPAGVWRRALHGRWAAILPALALGALLPELSDLLQPLWRLELLSGLTFDAVTALLGGLGYDVLLFPHERIIGIDGFVVEVGKRCSGIEGFALISVFLAIYMVIFRRELRFPRVFWLFPLGLGVSFGFNILRIALLMVLGAEASPDLAVGAFHSNAGWLSFVLLACAMMLAAHALPGLRRQTIPLAAPRRGAPLPFRQDPEVAQLLPFAAFMASGLLVSAFFAEPAVAYPLRALAMAVALAFVWPGLRGHGIGLDPVALAAGLAVGAAWIVTAAPPPEAAAPPVADTAWLVFRLVGTAVLVPVVEELFFRGYLLGRIAPPGAVPARLWLALAVSTACFAALHDRWIAAALAGLVFAALARRRGALGDAILAHMAANALIALAALLLRRPELL
ncbi:exosortase E/protease, VPEID-CTERM system (plasmid) [Limimaricola variabilis]